MIEVLARRFAVGDRVRWTPGAHGKAGEKTGSVARIIQSGERADVREPGLPRRHESYLIRADNGRFYWPRVQHLRVDTETVTVALSPDDRKALDWLHGELGGAGCDHVLPLLERLAAGR